jgi:hypothetical protein
MISEYRVGDIVVVQPYHRAKDEPQIVYEVTSGGLAGEMVSLSPLVWPIGEERPSRQILADILLRIP